MKSLKQKFTELRENKNWSDYLCFSTVVYGKGYTFSDIKKNFLKLVDKTDYHKDDLDEVLGDLYSKSLIGFS
jgi:hypothetical protein